MARLEIGFGDGSTTHPTDADNATPEAVIAAIAAMDGQHQSEVYLRDTSGAWIGLLGGPDRYFIGSWETDEGLPFQALADVVTGDAITIPVGGQPTTLESKYLVGRDAAVEAALHFLTTGHRSPSLAWEPQ